MKVLSLAVIAIAAACSSARDRTEPRAPIANAAAADASPSRGNALCLPVVAPECGCVYSCGVGVPALSGFYDVRHPKWKDTVLTARLSQKCVDAVCTEIFAAENIVCDGICDLSAAPDRTCHFEGERCVGAGGAP